MYFIPIAHAHAHAHRVDGLRRSRDRWRPVGPYSESIAVDAQNTDSTIVARIVRIATVRDSPEVAEMTDHDESAGAPEGSHPSIWRNRNFLRFFCGEFVTNVGDSLYTVAILWLVFRLSGSTFLTGVANSLLLLPWLLQIVAGPIVDRFSIKRLLVGAQLVQGIVILVLPLAADTGHLSTGLVLVTIPALSLVTLVLFPVQSALVPRIVAPDQLSRGNSALATVTLGLDMIFEAIGGALIATFGAMALFVTDSLTFAISGILFFGMVVPTADGDGERSEWDGSEYVDDLREGIDVLRGTVLVDMVFTSAVFHFALGVTLAILPAFGSEHGGPMRYGLLLGALGVGRMVGSMVASPLEGVPYGRSKAVAFVGSAALQIVSVYSPSTIFSVALFGLAWIPAGANDVLVSTLNQKVFPSDLLGRVSAIRGTASTATLPIGSLVGGFVAEQIGTTTTMGLAAFGFGFVGLYFALRSPLRNLPAMRDVTPADIGIRDSGETGD